MAGVLHSSARLVCTRKPEPLFYNQHSRSACLTAVVELHGLSPPLSLPLPLTVSLVYAASGEPVENQGILKLMDGPRAVRLSGDSHMRCEVRARIEEVSKKHMKQHFALRIALDPAAALQLGLSSVLPLNVGNINVKSKINPDRRKSTIKGAAEGAGGERGAGAEGGTKRRRESSAGETVLTAHSKKTMQEWGNAAVEVLRRVQWLPVGFEQMAAPMTATAAAAAEAPVLQDITRPIFQCPSCRAFKHGDGEGVHVQGKCDIAAMLDAAPRQKIFGEQGTTKWVPPATNAPLSPPASNRCTMVDGAFPLNPLLPAATMASGIPAAMRVAGPPALPAPATPAVLAAAHVAPANVPPQQTPSSVPKHPAMASQLASAHGSSEAEHQALAQQPAGAHGGGSLSGNHPSLGAASWSRITAELCEGHFEDELLDVDGVESENEMGSATC